MQESKGAWSTPTITVLRATYDTTQAAQHVIKIKKEIKISDFEVVDTAWDAVILSLKDKFFEEMPSEDRALNDNRFYRVLPAEQCNHRGEDCFEQVQFSSFLSLYFYQYAEGFSPLGPADVQDEEIASNMLEVISSDMSRINIGLRPSSFACNEQKEVRVTCRTTLPPYEHPKEIPLTPDFLATPQRFRSGATAGYHTVHHDIASTKLIIEFSTSDNPTDTEKLAVLRSFDEGERAKGRKEVSFAQAFATRKTAPNAREYMAVEGASTLVERIKAFKKRKAAALSEAEELVIVLDKGDGKSKDFKVSKIDAACEADMPHYQRERRKIKNKMYARDVRKRKRIEKGGSENPILSDPTRSLRMHIAKLDSDIDMETKLIGVMALSHMTFCSPRP